MHGSLKLCLSAALVTVLAACDNTPETTTSAVEPADQTADQSAYSEEQAYETDPSIGNDSSEFAAAETPEKTDSTQSPTSASASASGGTADRQVPSAESEEVKDVGIGMNRPMFAELDEDSNDLISREESQDLAELSDAFKEYDHNDDGQIDQSEFQAFEAKVSPEAAEQQEAAQQKDVEQNSGTETGSTNTP